MSAAPVVLFELLLPPLGFFARSSRTGAGARGATASTGCATSAVLALGAGAGDARARVAKRRVAGAANFMLVVWVLCGLRWILVCQSLSYDTA